jgi:hypothetical protein
MGNENRIEARDQVSLPLKFDGGLSAVTRDISASGLFFETDSEQRVGNLIDVEIDLDTPSGPIKFKAQGKIVRIEANGHRIGVGVELLNSRLEPVNSSV